MTENKRCTVCLQDKPISDFYIKRTAKDGLHPHCKECTRLRRLRYFDAPKPPPGHPLTCRSCGETKPDHEFPLGNHEKMGRRLHCNVCVRLKAEAKKPKGKFLLGMRDKGGRKSPSRAGRPKAHAPGGRDRPFKRYDQ